MFIERHYVMSNTYYLYSFYNTITTPTHCILISSCPITSFVKQIGDQVPKRSCQVKVMKPALRRVRYDFWSRKLRFPIVQSMPLLQRNHKSSDYLRNNLTGLHTVTQQSSNHLCQECSVFLAATPSQPLRMCCMQAVLGFYLSFTPLRSLVSEA